MKFHLQAAAVGVSTDSRADESLIALAATGQPQASIWRTAQGLVVPRTYTRSEAFEAVRQQFAQDGWPVNVRHSGGGVVPQGDGIINLSLAYAVQGKPLDHSDAAYRLICRIISAALLEYGIEARAQAVEGSFCDGRYNLAVGPLSAPRKVVGTAQVWRRQGSAEAATQVVLVHAIILAATRIDELTSQANRLELALGNSKRYLPCRAASLDSCGTHGLAGDMFTAALLTSLEQQVTAADLAESTLA